MFWPRWIAEDFSEFVYLCWDEPNGVDPQVWLMDVLNRIADHKINRIDDPEHTYRLLVVPSLPFRYSRYSHQSNHEALPDAIPTSSSSRSALLGLRLGSHQIGAQ